MPAQARTSPLPEDGCPKVVVDQLLQLRPKKREAVDDERLRDTHHHVLLLSRQHSAQLGGARIGLVATICGGLIRPPQARFHRDGGSQGLEGVASRHKRQ